MNFHPFNVRSNCQLSKVNKQSIYLYTELGSHLIFMFLFVYLVSKQVEAKEFELISNL